MREVVSIPLDEIFADEEFNCRGKITPMHVVELAKDLEARGRLIQPVTLAPLFGESKKRADATGKKYKYILIAGYRRYIAHKILEWATIDSIIDSQINNEQDARLFNLSENLHRKDLDILQEVKAVMSLYALGLNEYEIGEKIGRSRGWVQIRKMINSLPRIIKEEIAAGVFTIGPDIRDIYTAWSTQGEDYCIEYAKNLKENKQRGHQGKRGVVPKPPRGENTKRMRRKPEMMQMMDHLISAFKPGLHTRVLAWAAGEISDKEMYEVLKKHAIDNGLIYNPPSYD